MGSWRTAYNSQLSPDATSLDAAAFPSLPVEEIRLLEYVQINHVDNQRGSSQIRSMILEVKESVLNRVLAEVFGEISSDPFRDFTSKMSGIWGRVIGND